MEYDQRKVAKVTDEEKILIGEDPTGLIQQRVLLKREIGRKDDSDKPMMDILDPNILRRVADIFTFGAKKYGKHNFLHGMDWSRIYAAGQRHLMAWWAGEDKDPETGKCHLYHALCCLMMLSAHRLYGLGKDDRMKLNETDVDKD